MEGNLMSYMPSYAAYDFLKLFNAAYKDIFKNQAN